ncbi:FG-GAP repeat domain-containing protein [Streptomyces vietnamensis]|uniref:FG-GAP repeat domain-containing protein n=1 Tax=Streptomyces vietnamensis TaxID=362257 RepID=UPI000A7BDBFF|nr:VCBS repeat-containing protein [Streptomyces vietnamensis]
MRRIVALGGTAALLVAGLVSGAGAASAAGQDVVDFEFDNRVLQPGEGWTELSPTGLEGTPDGTLIYTLSKAPLTDPAWTKAGLPTGLSLDPDTSCKAQPGVVGVYLCSISEDNPFPSIEIEAAASTADNTTLHYGAVYAPRGTDLAKAVKDAQIVGSLPQDGTHAARTVTAKTLAHVARNTLALNAPSLRPGATVTHSVTLHAVDEGTLDVSFMPAQGMRDWEEGETQVTLTNVRASSPIADCDASVNLDYGGITCRIDLGQSSPTDVTVSYDLKTGATAAAWNIEASAIYGVYDFGTGNPEKSATFPIVSSRPVPTHYAMLARDKSGNLLWHYGTGKATAPFRDWTENVGRGWGVYNSLAKLSPITVQAKGGGIVGRDTSGVLWYYRTTGVDWEPLTARTKVGTGWGIYNNLTGVGDVTGDRKADLLARDASGVLWLYKGTGTTTAPFATRVRVGSGWGAYNQLTGPGDLNGDGKADLLARDTTGALWLYKGTGVATAPFAARVKVGTGWGAYPQLTGPGDLTDDGKADLVARDATGTFWLYKGTGVATAPFAARVKIGTGWGDTPGTSYNYLF